MAIAAAGGYVAVRLVLTGMPYIQTAAAAIIFAANLLINYLFLLTEKEKTFFKDFIFRRNSA